MIVSVGNLDHILPVRRFSTQAGRVIVLSALVVGGFMETRPALAASPRSGAVAATSVASAAGGYWAAARDGSVANLGDVDLGAGLPGLHEGASYVDDMAPASDGRGHRPVAADSEIVTLGGAGFCVRPSDVLPAPDRVRAANQVLGMSSIRLAASHPSGAQDNATAHQNVVATAHGRPACRSNYGTAPGGQVVLSGTVLRALVDIGSRWTISVSEIAGGSHAVGSHHYRGLAFDINSASGGFDAVVMRCVQLGASDSAIEDGNHVHCQWPLGTT